HCGCSECIDADVHKDCEPLLHWDQGHLSKSHTCDDRHGEGSLESTDPLTRRRRSISSRLHQCRGPDRAVQPALPLVAKIWAADARATSAAVGSCSSMAVVIAPSMS